MTQRTLLMNACAAVAFVGCAHAQPLPTRDTVSSRTTPATAPQAAAPTPAPATDTGLSDLEAMLRGDVLHFNYDQANLMPDSQQRLQKIARILNAHPQLTIRVEGNCDERGTEDYNLQLGQERADAAKKYLTNLGVDASRVSTLSYGKDRPENPAHTPDAWAENRRDDIKPAVRSL